LNTLKSIKLGALATVVTASIVLTAPSEAATATSSMGVSALVATGCTIVAAPLAFGTYDPNSGSPNDATTTVTVLCTVGTPYNVGLNQGGGTGATVATRKMNNGTDNLNYTLYKDSGRTTVWGNTVNTDTVSGTYTALQAPLTVYGRIPASQAVSAGIYGDTVTATITY
jgi:spore coat protein U-like protein